MTLAADFFRLFAGLDRAYGTYKITEAQTAPGDKVNGRAVTEHKPVTEELWEQHLEGKQGIGIVPIRDDATVVWAALDIDVYDLDHDGLNIKLLQLNLPMVLCKTKSGGAHLYIFFKQPIQAGLVRSKLQDWSVAIGFPGVEIFPKQAVLASKKDVGNWINMPYFNGSNGPRYALYNGMKLSPERFVELADKMAVVPKEFIDFQVEAIGEDFTDGPPCLQQLAISGFPRGTRNDGLFNIGVYTRLKYGDDWEGQLDELNRRAMNPPLASSEVQVLVKSLKKKTYFYTCNRQPIAGCCNKDVCVTRTFGVGQSKDSTPPLMLGSLTKLNSDPPIWFIDVEGVRMECTADDLLNQSRFRRICLERVNKLPPMLKQQDWDKLIRDRLNDVEIIETPKDASPEGQFIEHLHTFLTRSEAKTRDELMLGKPFWDTESGQVFFRSVDLIRYLDQMHFREYNERKVWSKLREGGAIHKQFQMKGKCVQTWAIPQFDRQTETHSPHHLDESTM